MSSNPWFKFYPSDWRADPALRMCGLAARGIWMEMLCLMHEAEPYGSLRINGAPVTDKQLASLSGASVREVTSALAELEAAGVFSRGEDDGVIFSRRMVRDKAKAERDRENGRGGGNPKIIAGVNPPVNGEDKAQKPEAIHHGQKKDSRRVGRPTAPDDFDEFWQAYPARKGDNPKAPARKVFEAAVKSGALPEDIIAGVKLAASRNQAQIGTEFIPQAIKWLRDRRWEDHLAKPANGQASSVSRDWDAVVDKFKADHIWTAPGPEPGYDGCKAPAEILAKHGYGPKLELELAQTGS